MGFFGKKRGGAMMKAGRLDAPDPGALKARRNIVGLIDCLRHKNGQIIRRDAADALVALRSKEALEPLRQMVHEDPDEYFRGVAPSAIADIGGLEELVRAWPDYSPNWVQECGFRCLAKLGTEEALRALFRKVVHRSSSVGSLAVSALANTSGDAATRCLCSILTSSDVFSHVRAKAAAVLEQRVDISSVPALVQALAYERKPYTGGNSRFDPDPDGSELHAYEEIRFRAARALGRLRDPAGIEPLTKCLADWSPNVRSAATEVLRLIQSGPS